MSKLPIALYVLATSAALVVLKYGTTSGAPIQIVDGKLQANITPYTVAGILLYAISFCLYVYLISKFDLGYIIALATGFVYILIFTASYFLFKETFTVPKVIGITLVIIGVILLNVKK